QTSPPGPRSGPLIARRYLGIVGSPDQALAAPSAPAVTEAAVAVGFPRWPDFVDRPRAGDAAFLRCSAERAARLAARGACSALAAAAAAAAGRPAACARGRLLAGGSASTASSVRTPRTPSMSHA